MILITKGGSMRPLISANKKISIQPLKKNEKISPGDVICYLKCNNLFLHRIYHVDDKYFFVKDDTGLMSLHPVKKEEVLGKLSNIFFPQGLIGLVYGLMINSIFLIGRSIKHILWRQRR